MKTVEQRIEEFCLYHRNGDGECNNVVLRAWVNKRNLNLQDKYELAYFFAITYCVESALVLFNERGQVFSNPELWSASNKQKLVFTSDRKYIAMKDSFERCLKGFLKNPDVSDFLGRVTENGVIKLNKAIPYVSSWELFGRFSAFLFLETFVELSGLEIENAKMDWKTNTTATSGIMNIFGYDNIANNWDKTHKTTIPFEELDKMLDYLTIRIGHTGGSTNVTEIETSLCAYRKFYKGSRYNGFYLDRMLAEIYKMQKDFPEISKELLEIRKQSYDAKYLGEISGWKGIRPEMKKLYKEAGIIT